jgi:hypothetical protein
MKLAGRVVSLVETTIVKSSTKLQNNATVQVSFGDNEDGNEEKAWFKYQNEKFKLIATNWTPHDIEKEFDKEDFFVNFAFEKITLFTGKNYE